MTIEKGSNFIELFYVPNSTIYKENYDFSMKSIESDDKKYTIRFVSMWIIDPYIF
jgi:hypothetical protein